MILLTNFGSVIKSLVSSDTIMGNRPQSIIHEYISLGKIGDYILRNVIKVSIYLRINADFLLHALVVWNVLPGTRV
jgi:hypothetical protein